MLDIHLLKEGRPSRPKTSIVVVGWVAIGMILAAILMYVFVNFIPAFADAVNGVRVDMVLLGNELHFDGVQSFTVFVAIPFGCLGSLVGAINLKRITKAKPFLGALHIVPVLGLITTIIGFLFYFLFPQVIAMIPVELTFDPAYLAYSVGALVMGVSIGLSMICAVLYRYINSSEYAPIYRCYKNQMKKAENATKRKQIKKDFSYFWKKRKYDDLICLLFGDNLDVECEERLTPDAFEYLKNKAIQAYLTPKKKQLEKMYKEGENTTLRRELAILCRTGAEEDPKKAAAAIDAKKEAGAAAPILPDSAKKAAPAAPAAPAASKPIDPKDQKVIDAEKQRLEKERAKEEERLKKELAEKAKEEAKQREAAKPGIPPLPMPPKSSPKPTEAEKPSAPAPTPAPETKPAEPSKPASPAPLEAPKE